MVELMTLTVFNLDVGKPKPAIIAEACEILAEARNLIGKGRMCATTAIECAALSLGKPKPTHSAFGDDVDPAIDVAMLLVAVQSGYDAPSVAEGDDDDRGRRYQQTIRAVAAFSDEKNAALLGRSHLLVAFGKAIEAGRSAELRFQPPPCHVGCLPATPC